MTAKYWTKDGEVMCMLSVRTVFDFKNLDTGEVVTFDNMKDIVDTGFQPVPMPKVKWEKPRKARGKKEKVKTAKTSKSLNPLMSGKMLKKGSKYLGVKREGKKFSASYWDRVNKKAKFLGMFNGELLAAAAVMEAMGKNEEARQMLNEHEERDSAMQPSEQ